MRSSLEAAFFLPSTSMARVYTLQALDEPADRSVGLTQKSAEPYTPLQNMARSSRERVEKGEDTRTGDPLDRTVLFGTHPSILGR